MDATTAVDLVMYCKSNYYRLSKQEVIETVALVEKYIEHRNERISFWTDTIKSKLDAYFGNIRTPIELYLNQ